MASESIDTSARLETPEHIEFEFRIAGPWRRAWAYALDFILRAIVLFVVFWMLMLSAVVFRSVEDIFQAHIGLALLLYFLVEWFYCVLFEWLWDGRTPGKKALGLRVIKDGGFPIGLQDSLLRNLLRGADLLPPLPGLPLPTYLVGALVSASDRQFRRLGDLVAGTLVVVDEPARLRETVKIDPPPRPEELSTIPPHPRLNVEEKKTIDAFMRRLRAIHPERREEICAPYAKYLAHRLGSPPPRSGTRYLQLVYARMSEAAVPLKRGAR